MELNNTGSDAETMVSDSECSGVNPLPVGRGRGRGRPKKQEQKIVQLQDDGTAEPSREDRMDCSVRRAKKIERLLVQNLQLVKLVMNGSASGGPGVAEGIINRLQSDNESLRAIVNDYTRNDFNKVKHLNSLLKRLRYYFDKAHEMKELAMASKSQLINIEEIIGKAGVKTRRTLVETIKVLVAHYVETSPDHHQGPATATTAAGPQGGAAAPAKRKPGRPRKIDYSKPPPPEEEEEEAGRDGPSMHAGECT